MCVFGFFVIFSSTPGPGLPGKNGAGAPPAGRWAGGKLGVWANAEEKQLGSRVFLCLFLYMTRGRSGVWLEKLPALLTLGKQEQNGFLLPLPAWPLWGSAAGS